ncbi:hypothetical protein RJ640_009535 [Escallonia rubra]|uniref:Protein FAR1-RELATED SEQUENCE n=1 Tax=Escallonia rubra TaxID=112253 RepID=A0AA88QZ78_9ASTE|nr:hypothetical protein RJ640_009535 [Escallonia rubra]
MANTGRTHMDSYNFQSIEQIDVNDCLTDHDILHTHVHDELETEATYEFYNRYALLNGLVLGNTMHIRLWPLVQFFGGNLCAISKASRNWMRRDLRIDYEAMIQVTLSKKLGMWVVDKFQDVHNHPLITTPSKVIKHCPHSKYHHTNVCKSLVADLNDEGLKPS